MIIPNHMPIIYALLAMIFWGLALFLAALASRKIGNVLTLFWMELFGLATGTVYLVFNHVQLSGSIVPNLPILFTIAILQLTAYLSFYKGTEKGQVSLVAPLGSSWSLITVLLSVIFLGEILKPSQIFAILLILAGIITVAVNIFGIFKGKSFKFLEGTKEGLLAMLGWGISLYFLILPSKELGWFIPAFGFRLFIVLMLLFYIKYSKLNLFPKDKKLPLNLLIPIGVFDMLAFFAYSLGVSKGFGSIVAPISSAYALVTIFLGIIFLKEKIGLRQIAGILGIISGLILISL